MNNDQAINTGAILERAFREIQTEFPQANPVQIDQFVKAEFLRANSGNEFLTVESVVANFRRQQQ